MSTHLLCLAKRFLIGSTPVIAAASVLEDETPISVPRVLPDRGLCPVCSTNLRWGELIKSCYRRLPHSKTRLSGSEHDGDTILDDSANELGDAGFGLNYCSADPQEDHASHRLPCSVTSPITSGPKKQPSSHKVAGISNRPRGNFEPRDKKKNPKSYKSTSKPPPENSDDEPEEDFVKMMDELEVSE